ncbi:MAG: hypothetical protein NLN65_05895 [Candidatus Poseidoniaceae archaeon]|nr:hypothetical protein [Candidatus Poseidoniaceae archaeon]|tara:strand:+ start:488 stop:775 length:288 start_codon:yes stop_codon:yes gene_type:complete
MIGTFLWFLAVGLFGIPIWILWNAGQKAASLDFRLAQNDASLLEDDGVIVTQMTGLPPGTNIVPDAHVVIVPEQPQLENPHVHQEAIWPSETIQN